MGLLSEWLWNSQWDRVGEEDQKETWNRTVEALANGSFHLRWKLTDPVPRKFAENLRPAEAAKIGRFYAVFALSL